MEICSWVEPQVDPLLSVPVPVGEDVSLESNRLPFLVPQELKVQLIMVAGIR